MCRFYTEAFTKTKMLEANGRSAYQDLSENICPYIDQKRVVNEIALVDMRTGKVTYGIYSLFKIIGHAIPMLNPLFTFKPFAWAMSKIYALVSYNRKIIIPKRPKPQEMWPEFKLHYRMLYLILSWFIAAYLLTHYGNAYREYLICGGQLFFQGAVCLLYRPQKLWDYLGNMMTISLAGSLLLLPLLWIHTFLQLHTMVYLLYFLFVAGLMLLEHLRRSKILDLGYSLTFSWLIYRLVILGFIMF